MFTEVSFSSYSSNVSTTTILSLSISYTFTSSPKVSEVVIDKESYSGG